MKASSIIFNLILCGLLFSSVLSCRKESLKVIPSVSISSVTNVTANSVTYEGSVTSDGGSAVTARGICWSLTVPTPSLSDTKVDNGSGVGSFTNTLSSLNPGETYYLRAYATNSIGTSYSGQITFTTLSLVPVLTTASLSSVTASTAISGGSITADGGSPILARGVCWSTTTAPTILNNKSVDGVSSGAFVSTISGLSPGITYYVRAYATNNIGTSYGNELTTTTTSVIPVLTTADLSAVTATNGTSGGTISSDGGSEVTARGVCWSISANPTIANSKSSDGTGIGSFTSSIIGLTAGSTYYVRAYATNSIGTAYGNQVTTVTTAVVPVVTTANVSAVISGAASGGGTISSDGGSAVIARGVCWSTTSNPTVAGAKSTDGTGTGTFTSSLTGLLSGTTYYVRAYATNSVGTSYGAEVTAIATAVPILTTNDLSAVTATTATSGGNITSDGGSPVTLRGVCWSLTPNPVITGTKTSNGSGSGSFTSAITGLVAGTTYYIRAYATNSIGTSYGNQITITTIDVVPVLTTTTTTEVTTTSISSGGNITSDGGSAVLSRGVCWSTTSGPTTASSKTSDGVSIGIFSSSITGLTVNETYYIRAYAINSVGTSYGNEVVITLHTLAPTLTTTAATLITDTSALLGGTITSDGDSVITVSGICWSTSANPTTSSSKTTDGPTSAGSFTTTISSLAPGTTYYVRAYATNGVGTSYGAQVSFKTLTLPTLTTTTASNVLTTTATSGGVISADGGASVTARGVCWSTSASPTTSDPKTTNGTGIGTFTSNITGLTTGTTYHVRSYATNSVGTAYGTDKTFTTN